MTTITRSFLGIPVEGEITYNKDPKEQYGLDRLAPLMQAVLDDSGVRCFGWHQYTPYFNDGEPCVFGVHGLWADPSGAPRRLVHLDPLPGHDLTACCSRKPEELRGLPQVAAFTQTAREVTCGLPDADDEYDEDARSDGVRYDSRWGSYEHTWRDTDRGAYTGPDEARLIRLLDLDAAICSGHYDDVLLQAFGDHAGVTVTRGGIRVALYEHD